MKLSKRQKDAIRLMMDGYELGTSNGFNSNVWLQLGGCGFGGKTEKITWGTFNALHDRNIIELKPNQAAFERPKRWQLTELGKSIEL